MSNKQMKRCPRSLAIREMKIKAMMRNHCITIIIANNKNRKLLTIPIPQMRNSCNTHALLRGTQDGTGMLENTLAVPHKVK